MPRDETTEQSTAEVPPPDPELQRLAPLLGTWRSEDHTNESMLGPGVPVTSVETFDWLEGRYFLVHTYETTFGHESAQKGVNYWGLRHGREEVSDHLLQQLRPVHRARQPLSGRGDGRSAAHLGRSGTLRVRARRRRTDQGQR
jgi:hypothetical protein